MTKTTEQLTAREFVWVHRIRQKVAMERVILTEGNPKERYRAKQFLQTMEQIYPELLEEQPEPKTLELFDETEYSISATRKRALMMPDEVLWEERVVRRAVNDYIDLFWPCDDYFQDAMSGLQYLENLLPELFIKARDQIVDKRTQILTFDIYRQCDCPTPEHQSAESFRMTDQGRLKNVSKRIAKARSALQSSDEKGHDFWSFFLERVKEVAPEMLEE